MFSKIFKNIFHIQTEVDSEGVAIGASAEQGGPPTTPPKHKGK